MNPDYDLFGDPIDKADPVDSLRRTMFQKLGEAFKKIDRLEARVNDLEKNKGYDTEEETRCRDGIGPNDLKHLHTLQTEYNRRKQTVLDLIDLAKTP